eukprot:2675309-Amphidinium_carterae.1
MFLLSAQSDRGLSPAHLVPVPNGRRLLTTCPSSQRAWASPPALSDPDSEGENFFCQRNVTGSLANAVWLSQHGRCLRIRLRVQRVLHFSKIFRPGRVQPRAVAFLELPARLAPQISEVELPFDFA